MTEMKIDRVLPYYFSTEQIQLLKDAVRYGYWGDCDMTFLKDAPATHALGCRTNDILRGGRYSDMSLVNDKISAMARIVSQMYVDGREQPVIFCPDWWGDGSGDMVFFNMQMLFEGERAGIEVLREWVDPSRELHDTVQIARVANFACSDNLSDNFFIAESELETTMREYCDADSDEKMPRCVGMYIDMDDMNGTMWRVCNVPTPLIYEHTGEELVAIWKF